MPENAPEPYKDDLRALGLNKVEVDYLANVRWLDELIGELLGELDRRGLRENTLVVYLSDNGWGLKMQRLAGTGRGKGTPYDIGSRTPILFSMPGTIPVADLPDLVLSSDIPPTILSFAGATRFVPESPGRSLRDRIEGGAGAPRADIVQHFADDTVLSPPWRYVRREDGSEELYRIDRDPFEFVDLARKEGEIVEALRARAIAHREALLRPPERVEIAGRVRDVLTGRPIVGGELRFGSEIVRTDSHGDFVVGPVAAGPDVCDDIKAWPLFGGSIPMVG